MTRFKDNHKSIYSFQDQFLVKCPRCHNLAKIYRLDTHNPDWFAPRRFSCLNCGASQDWAAKEICRPWYGKPVDDYFHYDLWLQAPCCSKILWAYNLHHLNFIEMFVKAKLRESKPDQVYGWSNKSLFSRLPKWIKSAHNRNKILKVIKNLRNSLPHN